jgi:hypothetical protein
MTLTGTVVARPAHTSSPLPRRPLPPPPRFLPRRQTPTLSTTRAITPTQTLPSTLPAVHHPPRHHRRFSSLDRSQYQAIRNLLTKEIAIVRGPPGTGKTYTGLKAVRWAGETRAHTISAVPPRAVRCPH